MTRKDYVLLASVIADVRSDPSCDARRRKLIARDIASALEADNPLFDRAKFLEACKLA